MKGTRILIVPLGALLATVGAWSVPDGVGPVAVRGVYSIHFKLTMATELPAGGTILCKARIAPNVLALGNQGAEPVAVSVATATGVATVEGSAASCALEIPFSWTVRGAQSGVALSYEIEAVSADGSRRVMEQSSGQEPIDVAYPSMGGAANLSFNVMI